MEILYSHCAGLDVHKKTVVACCVTPGPDGHPQFETRTFGTMTHDLLALSDWLTSKGITAVAMESTGELWKPVYNILESTFTVVVANAHHIKHVPGRKTDVKLRHEVASVAVELPCAGLNLVFCHQYPTLACDRSNSIVRSPADNVPSSTRWSSPCEGRRRLRASRQLGARVNGTG
jgi:hypothetical protein